MTTQLPLPISNPATSPESIAYEITMAQSSLRTMSLEEITSLVEEVKRIFEQVDSGQHPPAKIQFAKGILLGQSKLRPMTSTDISSLLEGLLGEQSHQTPMQFVYVPPTKQGKQYTREEALAAIHVDPSHVVCPLCNEKMKMLTKAHMRKHGITMEDFRNRFNLRREDVLVSQEIIDFRSEFMKQRGKEIASKSSYNDEELPEAGTYTREEALASINANHDHVVCLVCKEELQILTKAHMKKHGITVEEYRKRYNFLDTDILACQKIITQRGEAVKSRKGKKKISKKETISVPSSPPVAREYTRDEALASILADPEHVVCLICGQKKKVLTKGHMKLHGITMEEYRRRYNFLNTDPLVCQNTLEARSESMKQTQGYLESPTYIEGLLRKKQAESENVQELSEPTVGAEKSTDVIVRKKQN